MCFRHFDAKEFFTDFPATQSKLTCVIQLEECSHIRSISVNLCLLFCMCQSLRGDWPVVCVSKRNSISNVRHLPVKESWNFTDWMLAVCRRPRRITRELLISHERLHVTYTSKQFFAVFNSPSKPYIHTQTSMHFCLYMGMTRPWTNCAQSALPSGK